MKIALGRNKSGRLIIWKLQTPHQAEENSPSKSGNISDTDRLPVNEKIQPAWFKNLHDITLLYTRRVRPVVNMNPRMYDYQLRKLAKLKNSLGR